MEAHEFIDAGDQVVVSMTNRGRGKAAASKQPGTFGWCGRSGKARPCEARHSCAERKPSEPLGCGSRRCRRRTSGRSLTRLPPSTEATWMRGPSSGRTTSTTGRSRAHPMTTARSVRRPRSRLRAGLDRHVRSVSPVEPLEVIDAGQDQVVAVFRNSGRAKLSGVETDLTFAALYTVREGKIARGREYWTRDEALEAAGLSE
jgi:ketosteroid isomerase-like protein